LRLIPMVTALIAAIHGPGQKLLGLVYR